MSDEHTSRITQARAKLDTLRDELSRLKQRFIDAAVSHVPEWYSTRVRTIVTEDHGVTDGLDEPSMRALKVTVKQNGESIPDLLRTKLGDHQLWWHEDPSVLARHSRPNESGSDRWLYRGISDPSPVLLPALTRALQPLGKALRDAGYLRNARPLQRTPHDLVNGAVWSAEMTDIAVKYQETMDLARKAEDHLERTIETANRARASDRWDST